ncbi:MAG: endolytic transglycosylase MltG [Clostridia bacterium]|nr:endolytic transglycosylase MltG [Clostridia bacterium]
MGLLFTGIILAVPQDDLSKTEIEGRARELGMVYEDEILVFDDKGEGNEAPDDGEPNPEISREEGQGEEAATLVVYPGSTLNKVAGDLEKNGIIDDRDLFIELAKKLGMSGRIRTGTYRLKTNEDLYTVIRTITEKKAGEDE